MRYTLDKFPIFHQKYQQFYRFLADFLANRFLVDKIISVPANIRYFDDISTDISDFLILLTGACSISNIQYRFLMNLHDSHLIMFIPFFIITEEYDVVLNIFID